MRMSSLPRAMEMSMAQSLARASLAGPGSNAVGETTMGFLCA